MSPIRDEGEDAASRPGRQRRTDALPVQRKATPGAAETATDAGGVAQAGLAAAAAPLPHVDTIQRAFGPAHDLSAVKAEVGGPAEEATRALGANAFTTGDRVAFGGAPSLHTAAHEAAHVVQQRQGIDLPGGLGKPDDAWERQADAVADRVVRGESAAGLLGDAGTRADRAAGVQKDEREARDGEALCKPIETTWFGDRFSVRFEADEWHRARIVVRSEADATVLDGPSDGNALRFEFDARVSSVLSVPTVDGLVVSASLAKRYESSSYLGCEVTDAPLLDAKRGCLHSITARIGGVTLKGTLLVAGTRALEMTGLGSGETPDPTASPEPLAPPVDFHRGGDPFRLRVEPATGGADLVLQYRGGHAIFEGANLAALSPGSWRIPLGGPNPTCKKLTVDDDVISAAIEFRDGAVRYETMQLAHSVKEAQGVAGRAHRFVPNLAHASRWYVPPPPIELVVVDPGAREKPDDLSVPGLHTLEASTTWDTDVAPVDAKPDVPLPFRETGWDAKEILRRLGQDDHMVKTDSGGRCVQAVGLAIHVLHGPAAVCRHLRALKAQRLEQPKVTARARAAARVLEAVVAAIESRTARYGHLSWAQEGAHDLFYADDAGTPHTETPAQLIPPSDPSAYQPVNQECDSVAAVLAQIATLADGEQLVLGITGHVFLVYREGGRSFLYEPSDQQAHLVEIEGEGAALHGYFAKHGNVTVEGKVTRPRAQPDQIQAPAPGDAPRVGSTKLVHEITLDADGDQHAEMHLRFEPVVVAPSGHARWSVALTRLTSGETRAVTLPGEHRFRAWEQPIVVNTTNGRAPTVIRLACDPEPVALWLHPPASPGADGSGPSYRVELASGGKPVFSSAPLVFPVEERPFHRVADVSGHGRIADLHFADLTLGAYGDRFRLTVRTNGEQTTIGLSSLRGGEVTGGFGFQVPSITIAGLAVLETDGRSVAIDLDGDGEADVRVHDRITPFSPGTSPAEERCHEVSLSARGTGFTFPFVATPRTIVASGKKDATDLDATGSSQSVAMLSEQARLAGSGGVAGEQEMLRATLILKRAEAVQQGILDASTFEALVALVLAMRRLRPEVADDDPEPRRDAAGAAQALRANAVARHPDQALLADLARLSATLVAPLPSLPHRERHWARVFELERSVVQGFDALIVAAWKSRAEAAGPDSQAAQKHQEWAYLQAMERGLADVAGKKPRRILAVFVPDPSKGEEHEQQGAPRQLALSVYLVKDEKLGWSLIDLTSPTSEGKPVALDGDPDRARIEEKLAILLGYSHGNYPRGRVHYQTPSGEGGSIETTGEKPFYQWLIDIGGLVLLAGIALGLLASKAGAPMAVVLFGEILTAAGAISVAGGTAWKLAESIQQGQATTASVTMDLATIVSCLSVPGAQIAGSVKLAPRLGSATKLYLPILVTGATADVVWLALATPDLVAQLDELLQAPMLEEQRRESLRWLVVQWFVMTGLTLWGVKGVSAAVLSKRPALAQGSDGTIRLADDHDAWAAGQTARDSLLGSIDPGFSGTIGLKGTGVADELVFDPGKTDEVAAYFARLGMDVEVSTFEPAVVQVFAKGDFRKRLLVLHERATVPKDGAVSPPSTKPAVDPGGELPLVGALTWDSAVPLPATNGMRCLVAIQACERRLAQVAGTPASEPVRAALKDAYDSTAIYLLQAQHNPRLSAQLAADERLALADLRTKLLAARDKLDLHPGEATAIAESARDVLLRVALAEQRVRASLGPLDASRDPKGKPDEDPDTGAIDLGHDFDPFVPWSPKSTAYHECVAAAVKAQGDAAAVLSSLNQALADAVAAVPRDKIVVLSRAELSVEAQRVLIDPDCAAFYRHGKLYVRATAEAEEIVASLKAQCEQGLRRLARLEEMPVLRNAGEPIVHADHLTQDWLQMFPSDVVQGLLAARFEVGSMLLHLDAWQLKQVVKEGTIAALGATWQKRLPTSKQVVSTKSLFANATDGQMQLFVREGARAEEIADELRALVKSDPAVDPKGAPPSTEVVRAALLERLLALEPVSFEAHMFGRLLSEGKIQLVLVHPDKLRALDPAQGDSVALCISRRYLVLSVPDGADLPWLAKKAIHEVAHAMSSKLGPEEPTWVKEQVAWWVEANFDGVQRYLDGGGIPEVPSAKDIVALVQQRYQQTSKHRGKDVSESKDKGGVPKLPKAPMPLPDPGQAQTILVMANYRWGLGDAVLHTQAVGAIQKKYPGARIVVCEHRLDPTTLRRHEMLAKVQLTDADKAQNPSLAQAIEDARLEIQKRPYQLDSLTKVFEGWDGVTVRPYKQAASDSYDLVVDLGTSVSADPALAAVGQDAPIVAFRDQPGEGMVPGQAVDPQDPHFNLAQLLVTLGHHKTLDEAYQALKQGVGATGQGFGKTLRAGDADFLEARKFLEEKLGSFQPGDRPIAFYVGASERAKMLDVGPIIELLQGCSGRKVLLFAGKEPHEAELLATLAPIVQSYSNVVVCREVLPIHRTYALLCHCERVLCNDTAIAHIAEAAMNNTHRVGAEPLLRPQGVTVYPAIEGDFAGYYLRDGTTLDKRFTKQPVKGELLRSSEGIPSEKLRGAKQALEALFGEALFTTSTVKGSPARKVVIEKIDRVLRDLDAASDPPLSFHGFCHDAAIASRIEAILGTGSIELLHLRKLRYLEGPEYQVKDATGIPDDRVHIYGQDSDVSPGKMSPGHIMATVEGDLATSHASYAPVDAEKGQKGGPFESFSSQVDKVPPYPGASDKLVPGAKPGKFLDAAKDKYRDVPSDFDHAFHPEFLHPDDFRKVVVSIQQAEERLKDAYVLFTSKLKEGEPQVTLGKYPDREVPHAVVDGEPTVQAKNCVTEMINVLRGLKTRTKPQWILDDSDLMMLGINADGTFVPGRDLRTQDLYEHLRWKEHEFLTRHGLSSSE